MKNKGWGGWGCVVALATLTIVTDVLPRLLGDLLSHFSVSSNTMQHLLFDAGVLAIASLGLLLWKLGVRLRQRRRS